MNEFIPTILHVEDSPSDRLLLATAFRKANLTVHIQAAEDGEKSMEYLAGNGVYADRDRYPLPDLVLLDLKLPRQSGLEVLDWIRSQPRFKSLPVVILSSSEQAADTQQAMQLGANAYLVKPVSLDPLKEMVREIYAEWLAPRHH